MRNIYELLGIIKGISFDGIINDKEGKEVYTCLSCYADAWKRQ